MHRRRVCNGWDEQVYDLVRDPQGQVLLFGKDARFGQEQIDAAHLLGWVDDAR